MSQPDSISSVDSISFAIPTSILIFFIIFMMFQWEYIWSFFRMILYLGIPILVYLLTSVVTLLAQYSGCGNVRVGDVFLYSLPSAVFSWMALFISYFSWCRIPIASVIAPLFIQDEKNGENGEKRCCAPSMTLETIEIRAPMVKGFAYGFYLFFSTVFGLLVSIGFATIC
jgi:hypothetical protein